MYPGDPQVESRIAPAVRSDLLQRGHKLYDTRPYSIGSNAAIAADSVKSVVTAGADPRVGAFAVAWVFRRAAWGNSLFSLLTPSTRNTRMHQNESVNRIRC